MWAYVYIWPVISTILFVVITLTFSDRVTIGEFLIMAFVSCFPIINLTVLVLLIIHASDSWGWFNKPLFKKDVENK